MIFPHNYDFSVKKLLLLAIRPCIDLSGSRTEQDKISPDTSPIVLKAVSDEQMPNDALRGPLSIKTNENKFHE